MTHSLLMDARVSELAVVCWCIVAAIVAVVRPLGARGRRRVMGGGLVLAVAALATTQLPDAGLGGAARNLMPALFVLAAYWLAGGFFVGPQPRLEQRLLSIDHYLLAPLRLETRPGSGSRWGLEVLEAAYFSVYALLPLGAWTAFAQGGSESVDIYWTVVFLSEASCYIALAWLQTRPPRALEPWAASIRERSFFRQANEVVLSHGSHHMNTLPSGHAAGAVAVALALASLHVPTAPFFGVAAVAICVATVVGRYHFLVDTVAGVAVAVGWWDRQHRRQVAVGAGRSLPVASALGYSSRFVTGARGAAAMRHIHLSVRSWLSGRAPPSHGGGHWFESSTAHHLNDCGGRIYKEA